MAKPDRIAVTLRVGPLAEADLRVARVRGREALSRTFHFDVELEPAGDDPLVTADLVGEEAQLTFRRHDGAERFVHGVAEAVELVGVRQKQPHYRLRLVPRLALLAHRRDSRVFQELSVPEVVQEVLDAGGVEVRLDLQASHPKREYCVQWQESDLAFVSRLLAEEGIAWFFEQADGSHTLVLCDAPQSFADVPGDPLPFRPPQPGAEGAADEHVSACSRSGQIRTSKATLRDYDLQRPDLDLTAQGKAGGGGPELEAYEYRLRYADPGELKRLAGRRLERERVAAAGVEGESNSLRLAAGLTFELAEHPDGAMNQRLQVTALEVVAARPQQMDLAATPGFHLSCRFEAQAAGTPWRPPADLARPVVVGTQTARVVGPSGEEIHDDKLGRIKVQFPWDRKGGNDDHSSCFVRVAQPWAGPGWGASYVPRIGQEVLVRFLDGDPDRPLVVGAVYNGTHATPIALPDDKTRSTLRSDSSLGGGGYNELRFEDLAGEEEVYLHAQKDETAAVENDKTQTVGNDEALEVAKDRTQQVDGDQSLQVSGHDASAIGGNRTLTVEKDRTTTVSQDHAEQVAVAQSIQVGRAQTVLVGQADAATVGAAAALTIGGAYAVTVAGLHNTAVGGARLEQVAGLKAVVVGAAREELVGGEGALSVGGDLLLDAKEAATSITEKDQQEDVGGKAGHQAKEATAWLMKSLQLETDDLKVVVGGKLLLRVQKSGAVTFSASKFTVDASGAITTKGSEVKKTSGGGGGGSASVAKLKREEKEEKKATAKAKWSKAQAEPFHYDASGSVPGTCDVTPEVELQNVPDGKKGVILICHLASGAVVKGGKIACEAKGGKLVDKKTGKPPVFHFGPEQLPWDPYDKPFFFLQAQVEHQGLKVESEKDEAKALRVKYYQVCVADGWADTPAGGNLTTAAEADEIGGILAGVPHSKVEKRIMKSAAPTHAQWGKAMAGSYAYHHASHGSVYDPKTGDWMDTDLHGDPPTCPVGTWNSVVLLSFPQAGRPNRMDYLRLSVTEMRNKTAFPSAPRYLAYLDCCLAGWEPSLGRAFVGRGTAWVIAYRRTIPDGDAREMARKFHRKWAGTHKLDPDKIRDLFFEVGAPYYESMRPVLIGWRYEEIPPPGAGALSRAWSAITSAIGGIASSVTSLFK